MKRPEASVGLRIITPEWPAPATVRAAFTTRHGGLSRGPWRSFNLAAHVDDDPRAVAGNRALLQSTLGLTRPPCWLAQQHGATVARFDAPPAAAPVADAAITRQPNLACAVLVADCVPVLLCARDGSEVAAVHAGWRGLDAGIVARAVASFHLPAAALHAWIGPCIGTAAYRVGSELVTRFTSRDAAAAACFHRIEAHWHLDLQALARQQLAAAGVGAIAALSRCVFDDADDFFSFRRDRTTGRMAAMIWVNRAAGETGRDITKP
ncbi:MAG: peptidoglycan editing factor PgeF [Gammaproteobacteria bacterium]